MSLIEWPDPRLRQKSAPVGEITPETQAIWDLMVSVMEAMPGYGLAAPQLGIMQRLAVVDCSRERGRVVYLADPEIVATGDGTHEWEEASPNLPGFAAWVTRPSPVTVAFTDREGNRIRQTFEELWATSVQHQIDHLNGKMFFDRLSRTKRAMILKKAGKRR